MSRRAAIIVLDGLGIGPAADTDAYGDAGSNTLGNVARAVGGLALPQLEALGARVQAIAHTDAAALEAEMLKREMSFEVIDWSENQAKLPFEE